MWQYSQACLALSRTCRSKFLFTGFQAEAPDRLRESRAFDCKIANKSATRRYSSSSSRSSALMFPSLALAESSATRWWSSVEKSKFKIERAASAFKPVGSNPRSRPSMAGTVLVVIDLASICRDPFPRIIHQLTCSTIFVRHEADWPRLGYGFLGTLPTQNSRGSNAWMRLRLGSFLFTTG